MSRLTYGSRFSSSTPLTRHAVNHGTIFPLSPSEAELFYKTDTRVLYIYDEGWKSFGMGTGGGDTGGQLPPWINTEQGTIRMSRFHDDLGLYGTCRKIISGSSLPYTETSERSDLFFLHAEGEGDGRPYFFDGTVWVEMGTKLPQWLVVGESNAQSDVMLSGFGDDIGVHTCERFRRTASSVFPPSEESNTGDVLYRDDVKGAYVFDGNTWVSLSASVPPWVLLDQGSVPLSSFDQDIDLNLAHRVRVLNHVPSSGTSTQGDIILHAGNGHDASLRVFDGNEFVPVSPPPWSSENMKNIQALGFDTQGLVLHSEVSPIATTEQSKVPISGFLDDFGLGISREALAVDALPIPVVSLEGSLRYDRTSRRLYACDGSRWIPSSGPDPPPWSMRGQDQIFLSGFADDVGIGMGHSLRLHELTEFPLPGEAARGDVMFKTDVKTAYVYTGNEWAPMSGAGGGLPSWVSRLQGSVALSGFYDDIGIGVSKYVRAKNYLPPNEHAGEILYHTGARALLVSDGNAWEYVTPPWITTDPVDILVLGTFDTTGLIKEGDLPIWIKNDQGLIPISAFSDDVGLSTASKVRSVDTSKVQLPPSSANREIGEILYDTVSGAIMVYDKRGVWSPQRPAWVKDEPGSIRIGTFTNDVGYLTSSSIPDWVLGSETQNDLRLSGFIDDLAPGRGIRVAATLPSNHEEGDIVYSSGSVYFSKGSSWAALRPSWVSDQSSGVPVGDFYNDVGYVKAGDLPSWFAQDSRDVTLSSFRNDLDITISIGVRDYTTLPASGESNAVPGHLVTKQGTVYAYDGSRWVPQRPGWVIESPSDISLSVFKNDVGFVRSINLPVWASTMQQSLVPLSGFLDDVDIKYATNIKQVSSVESLRGRGGAQGGEVSYSLAERDLYYYREGGNGVGSGWRAIRPNWVLDSQNDILVSKFINDVGYITETEPARKLSLSQPIVSSSNDVGAVYYHGRSTGAQQASSIRVWDGTRWLVTFASATEIMKMTSSWIPGVNSNPSQLVGSARFQRLSPDIELEFGSYVGIGFDVVNGHASNIRTIFVAPTNAMAPQMPTDNDTDVEIVWPVFVQGVYGGATLAVLAVPWIGGDLAVFAQAIAAENVGSLSSDAILTHEPPPSCDEQNQNQASPLGFAEFGVRVEIIHGDFSVEGSIMGANVLGVEPVSPPASLVMFKLPVDGRLCVDSVERVPVAYPARAVEGRLQVHDHVGTAVYGLAYGNVIGKDVAAYAPVLTPGGGRMFDVHVSRQVNLLEPGWSVVEHTVVRRDTARTCIVIALVTPDSLPVFDPANSSLPGPQYARSLPSGYDGSADVTNSHARSLGHVQWSDEDGAYVSSDVEERGALYPKLIACRVDCCESGEGYPARAVAWEYIGEPWSNIGKMLHGWEWSGGSRGTDLLYKVFERTWIWIKYGSSGIYDEFVADGKLLTWFKSHIIGNASRLGQEQMSLVHSRVHPNTRDKGFDQGYAYHNSIFTLVTHTIINGGAMLALHDALHSTENYLRSESALRATRTVDGWLLPGPNCFRCNKLTYAEHIADEGGGSSEDYYLLNPAKASVTPNASASGGGVTNGFTISIWLKIEEYIEPAYVLSMRGDNTGTGSNDYCSISVLPRPGGERTVVKVKFGFVGNDFWHGATVNDGEFHHVYVEYLNDSNYGDRILIAVDGVIETYDIGWRQLVSVAETSVDVSRPTGMRIGRSWDETTPSTFIGLVDELAIWTGRALWLGGGGLGLEGGGNNKRGDPRVQRGASYGR